MAGALGAASAANLRLNGRGLPSHVQALAILVSPQRGYATEHSTSTSAASDRYPPPGFNAQQAQKPLSPEASQQVAAKADLSVASKDVHSKAHPTESGVARVVAEQANKKVAEEKKEQKKLTMGQKIKKEVQHYWDGTKLLATEVRISSRLALKMAGGYELSRREQRQVCLDYPWCIRSSG